MKATNTAIDCGRLRFLLEIQQKFKYDAQFHFLKQDGSIEPANINDNLYSCNWSEKGIGVISKSPKGEWGGEISWHGFRRRNIYDGGQGRSLEEVAANLYAKYLEEVKFNEEMKDPAKELEYLKSVHDTYFEYSDDHRVWAAGRASLNRIQELEKIVSSQ